MPILGRSPSGNGEGELVDMPPRKASIVNSMSDEEFSALVSRHRAITHILIELNFSPTSGAMAKMVKNRIKRDSIDISHMTRKGQAGSSPRHKMVDILVEHSSYTNIGVLKRRLVKEGILKYQCIKCGNTGTWMGEKLALQLDHKNGKHFDHRIENLRFLCPNCHSQTLTYSGKNMFKAKHGSVA